MPVTRESIRVTFPSASNTGSVPAGGNLESENYSLNEATSGASISCKAEKTTPVAGDIITFFLLQTNGDTDGSGGADEFDTPNNAKRLGQIDLSSGSPQQKTFPLAYKQLSARVYAVSSAASGATTISCLISATVST